MKICLKSGSDGISQKKPINSATYLQYKEILHAKFDRNRIVRFRSSTRKSILHTKTYIHKHVHTSSCHNFVPKDGKYE